MVLDPLIQLIETLAQRIQQHRQALSQSEALTRYVLIDPLLRALGWDTEDPEQVQPEYSAGGGAADYALLEQGKPQVLVEAKRLGNALSAALEQNIGYCIRTGAPYLVNTDGQRWEVYDIYKQGPIDQKRVVTFDIASTDQNKVAAAAIFLWRGNYRQVAVPAATLPPPATVAQLTPAPQPPLRPVVPLVQAPSPGPTAPPTGQNLANFAPKPGDKAPTNIIAPDGASFQCGSFKNLLVRVATWLAHNNKLTASQCPVSTAGAWKRYLIHTQPVHRNGNAFRNGVQAGSLWVETHANSLQNLEYTRFLLKLVNEDPARWEVK
ncbi:MAG: hypothetical protein HYX99_02700 [Chloroflexi bacterium]|nr:hypothetical protein [Chloroflexota bacterium]